jgi:hypothetical protein
VHLIDVKGMLMKYPKLRLRGGIASMGDELETMRDLQRVETLLAQMDEAGIDQSILYAVQAPMVYASNRFVHKLCQAHPDRFIGFASVDPNEPDAVEKLTQAVENYGLRGLKLHPALQKFSPDDRRIWPVYEKAAELDIPVVFHVGTTPFGDLVRLAHANPLTVDDVAVEFPTLRIMLTHLGTLWHNEAFMVTEKNPNVFIDTAAYLYEIPKILTPELLMRVGVEKFVFGTDFPMSFPGQPHRMKEFVDCIEGLGFDEPTREAIFHKNATELVEGRPILHESITLAEQAAKVFVRSLNPFRKG